MVEVKHKAHGKHDVVFFMDGDMYRLQLYGDEYIEVSDEVYECIKDYVRVKPGPSPVDEPDDEESDSEVE